MQTADKLSAARLVLICLLLSGTALSSTVLLAQAPPTPQGPKPTPKPAPRAAAPAPTRATLAVLVTDRSGDPIEGVAVGVTGPVDREAKSDAGGNALLRNLGEGTYRLRFEHPAFITLEREVTMQSGRPLRTSVALNAAPKSAAPPPSQAEPAAPQAPAAPALPPPGSQPATSLSIPEVFEDNPIGRDPTRNTAVGCAGLATATLIQVRDPLVAHAHDDADEALYVVAGQGVERVGDRDVPLTAGTLAMVPRGTPHAIMREGSRVLVLLSILSGPPCTAK